MLPLRSVGRSNFDKGLHNLTTLIKKRHILNENSCNIYMYIKLIEILLKFHLDVCMCVYLDIYVYIYIHINITTCERKCNINCHSSMSTILSTLFSLRSFLVATMYMHIYIYVSALFPCQDENEINNFQSLT